MNVTERELSSGDLSRVASGDLERVITAAVKLYVAKTEVEGKFPAPVSTEITTPTEIVVVVSEHGQANGYALRDGPPWLPLRRSGNGGRPRAEKFARR